MFRKKIVGVISLAVAALLVLAPLNLQTALADSNVAPTSGADSSGATDSTTTPAAQPSSTPTTTPTATPTPTPTPTAPPTATPTDAPTPSPTATPTGKPTPDPTAVAPATTPDSIVLLPRASMFRALDANSDNLNAVTNLTAVNNNDDTISISWNDPAGIDPNDIEGYDLSIVAQGDGSVDQGYGSYDFFIDYSGNDSYTWTGIAPLTYTLTLTPITYDNASVSPASTDFTDTYDATVPQPVTNVQAYSDLGGSAQVYWDAPDGDGGAPITGYEYDATDLTAGGDVTGIFDADATSGEIDNLNPGDTYSVTILADNTIGAGDPGNSLPFEENPGPADAVTNLSITPNFDGTASLTWDAAVTHGSPVNNYTYQAENLTDNGAADITGDFSSDATSGTISGLTLGASYRVSIYTNSDDGTQETTAAPFVEPAAPSAPTDFVIMGNSDGTTADATWAASSANGTPVTSYVYRRYLASDSSGAYEGTFDTGTTSGTLTGLVPGTSYEVYMIAESAAGESLSTQWSYFTEPTPVVAPDPVPSIWATTSPEFAANGIWLDWDVPNNTGDSAIVNYTVTLYDQNGAPVAQKIAPSNTSSEYFTTGVDMAPGQTYSVGVVVNNSDSSSSEVTYGGLDIPAVAPSAPTNPTLTLGENGNLTASWGTPISDGGDPIEWYQYQIFGSDDTFYSQNVDAPANSTDLGFAPTPGVVYNMYLFAYSNDGQLGSTDADTEYELPLPVAPDPIQNLTTATSSNTGPTVNVSWEAPGSFGDSNITNYTVALYDINYTLVSAHTVSADTLTDTFVSSDGIMDGNQYYVSVIANNSDSSSYAIFTNLLTIPQPFTAPGDITNFSQYADGSPTVYVSWEAPENTGDSAIVNYTVTLQDTSDWIDGPTAVHTVTSPSDTFTAADGVLNGHFYVVSVIANNADSSSESVEHDGSVQVPATNPSSPQNPTLTVDPYSNDLVANWETPTYDGGSDITSYWLTAYDDTSEDLVYSEYVDGSATSQDLGFTPTQGDTYTFSIYAQSSNGMYWSDGAYSPSYVAPSLTPDEIQNFTDNTTSTPDLEVSWDAPDNSEAVDVDSYTVTLTDEADSSFTITRNVTGLTTEFIAVDGILNGHAYAVSIVANSSRSGLSSDSVTETGITIPLGNPSNPTDFTLSVGDNGDLFATWTAPTSTGGAPLAFYQIDIFASDSTVYSVSSDGDTTSDDLGFAPTTGTSYTAYIKAYTNNGMNASGSVGSNTYTLPVAAVVAPDDVTGLYATRLLDGDLGISWTAPASIGTATGIYYQIAVFGPDGEHLYNYVNGNDITYDAPLTVVAGGSYTVWVTVYSYDGNSASTGVSYGYDARTIPDGVADLNVNADSTPEVIVSWTPPHSEQAVNVDSYTVTLYEGTYTTPVATHTVDGNTDTFTADDGVVLGGNYYVLVVANGDVASSAEVYSDFVTVPYQTPDAPTGVSLSTGNSGDLVTSWTPPTTTGGSEITFYRLQIMATDANGDIYYYYYEYFPDGEADSYETDLPVIPGVTYVAYINVLTDDGSLISATAASDSYMVPEVPDVAQNVTAIAAGDVIAPEIVVNWDVPDNAPVSAITGYTITLTDEADGSTIIETVTGNSDTFTPDDGIQAGHTYDVTVVTNGAAGSSSPASASDSVTAPSQASTAPSVPTDLTGYADGYHNAGAFLGWNAPNSDGGSAIIGYDVTITNMVTGVQFEHDILDADTTWVEPANLDNGTEYTFAVKAENAIGGSETASYNLTTEPYVAPAPDQNVLNNGNVGDVTLTIVGDQVTAHIPDALPGDWAYGYVYSTPQDLGWEQVDANNNVTWTLPVLPAGTHHVVITDNWGDTLGVEAFTVAETPTTKTPPSSTVTGNVTFTSVAPRNH